MLKETKKKRNAPPLWSSQTADYSWTSDLGIMLVSKKIMLNKYKSNISSAAFSAIEDSLFLSIPAGGREVITIREATPKEVLALRCLLKQRVNRLVRINIRGTKALI